MREILFRAKSADNYPYPSRWEYGGLFQEKDGAYMIKTNYGQVEVKEKTVGEFTGVTDCNGNKIFEGDIVTCRYGGKKYKGKIIYWDCAFCVSYSAPIKFIGTLDDVAIDCEIIGNIHDNPKLLGGDDNAAD